jgi:hypothetical protein
MPFNRFDHERDFLARLDKAWKRGAAQYGDVSFDKPLAATAEEILAEYVDIAGWASIGFMRVRAQLDWIARSAEALGLSSGPVTNASYEDGS